VNRLAHAAREVSARFSKPAMSVRSRLGGVDRETLLRGWFLLFVWVWMNVARSGFAHPGNMSQSAWVLWVVWLFGSALTFFLIARRNRLAGIVGFLIGATLVAYLWLLCVESWSSAFWLATHPGIARSGFAYLRHILPPLGHALFATAQAIVPLAVLARHFATRHRLMLYGRVDNIDTDRDSRRRPGSYYFVTSN